jgi:uncharacterized protein (DUF952 family)
MGMIRFLLLAMLLVLSFSATFASETLFHLVRRTDWLAHSDPRTYRPVSLATSGFVPLLTQEKVVSTARIFFQGASDLLLLRMEVPTNDPLLKWETPSGGASSAYYYGAIPREWITQTYEMRPQPDGSFAFPKEPFQKQLKTQAIPNGLVNKFLRYHQWQKTGRLHRIQEDNFLKPKVQLQWWYFDFFLADGSTVVLAFIPQLWWNEKETGAEKKALMMMSMKTPDGKVQKTSATFSQSDMRTSADHLEIPSRFLIRSSGSGRERKYTIRVNVPGVAASFDIAPTRPPFAAFPTGVMPGFLQTWISGAPQGAPSFSYVSQIPRGNLSGKIAWEGYEAEIIGQAYHEQGRLDDTPERQGSYWTWYHFSGEGWNIFGSPGTYVYLQKGDTVLRSGFHLVSNDYQIRNRTFDSDQHAKIMTGAEIRFRHEGLTFQLKMPSATAQTMISYPSADPNQVWGTVEGPAELWVTHGKEKKRMKGRMMLETCSWESTKAPAVKSVVTR